MTSSGIRDKSMPKPKFSIPFGQFALCIVCLPIFSFAFCVLCSLLFYFEEATFTHCEVRNYLPSLSAAIGRYQPQRFVWQFAICLHFLPRLSVAQIYYEYYKETIRTDYISLAYFACFLNVVENLALLGLSMWTSSESYEAHKLFFLIFIATSEVYMVTSYFLNKNGKRVKVQTIQEKKSLNWKRNLFITNLIAFGLTGYFFVRHNKYCEPGVYTLFAFFEYTVVMINISYHMTAFWDFYNRIVSFDWKRGFYFEKTKSS